MARPIELRFLPLNARQREAAALWQQVDLLWLLGAAGSGKTHLAVALALLELQARGLDRIHVVRPAVEAGERLGSLPGGIDDKMAPFMAPIWDCLQRVVPRADLPTARKLFEPCPLAFLRGRTFTNSVGLLDEGQNTTRTQLKLFLTRLGQDSKLIVTADPHQSDIRDRSGLLDVVDALRDLPRVGVVYFEADDCVRHPLVTEILKRI